METHLKFGTCMIEFIYPPVMAEKDLEFIYPPAECGI
jgi:hypothetical protein